MGTKFATIVTIFSNRICALTDVFLLFKKGQLNWTKAVTEYVRDLNAFSFALQYIIFNIESKCRGLGLINQNLLMIRSYRKSRNIACSNVIKIGYLSVCYTWFDILLFSLSQGKVSIDQGEWQILAVIVTDYHRCRLYSRASISRQIIVFRSVSMPSAMALR